MRCSLTVTITFGLAAFAAIARADEPATSTLVGIDCEAFITEADLSALGAERVVEAICRPGRHEFQLVVGEFDDSVAQVQLVPLMAMKKFLDPVTKTEEEALVDRFVERRNALEGIASGRPSLRIAGGRLTEESTYGDAAFVYVPKDKNDVQIGFRKGPILCLIDVSVLDRDDVTPKQAEVVGRKLAALCAKRLP